MIDKRRTGLSRYLICLLVTLSLIVPIGTFATISALGEEEAQEVVRVGWYDSPFNYKDEDGRRSGYAYEYQQKIAAYTGWDYEYVEGSWPDLLEMVKSGEIDLMSDVSYTDERAEQMSFASYPMGAEAYYVFISVDNTDIKPGEFQTLTGKRVGVNKGSFQEQLFLDWAEKNDVDAEVVELTGSEDESVQMLVDGKIDAYVTIDAYGDTSVYVPIFKVGESEFFFTVPKERTELVDELNMALAKIQDEDRQYNQRLYDTYVRQVVQ